MMHTHRHHVICKKVFMEKMQTSYCTYESKQTAGKVIEIINKLQHSTKKHVLSCLVYSSHFSKSTHSRKLRHAYSISPPQEMELDNNLHLFGMLITSSSFKQHSIKNTKFGLSLPNEIENNIERSLKIYSFYSLVHC